VEKESKTRRILLTGARSPCALELSRNLNRSGHTVFAADTSSFHVALFSNSVEKFYAIPSPRYDIEGFISHLSEIITKEKIDLLIPIWEEVMYISLHKDRLPKSCEVFCAPFKLLHHLHNKWLFIKLLNSYGIKAPHSVLVNNNKELEEFSIEHPYVLKRCYSRGSRYIIKVMTPEPPPINIDPENPWIAQEYIEGDKYCSYSVCYQGKVLAHAVYPVKYTMDGNSCLAFEAIDHPKILRWIKNLADKTGYTGQWAFDFIETPQGVLYAIECNPRATSGLHLFGREDRLDRAFFHETTDTIIPRVGNSKQIATGMLMYGLGIGRSEKRLQEYLKKFFTTKDVVFSLQDLKPFLFEPLVLTSYWLKSKKKGLSIPVMFTHDLDWDEDPAL
jgi:predicted ATP-grasp superfamily ATP-dependent carboligase